MPNMQNGVYSNRPWIAPPEAAYPPQAYIGPFASNQEQNLSQAMAALNMTSEQIQEYVRPNLPQIKLFPDRFGYETNAYGMEDLVNLNVPMNERVDTPNPAAQAQSTSRNTLGNGI